MQAVNGTNGADLYASANGPLSPGIIGVNTALQKFQQKPPTPASSGRQRQLLNVMLDTTPLSDVLLPSGLQPVSTPVNGSFPAGAFFLRSDNKTGVFALGSFSGTDLQTMQVGMLEGLLSLKAMGATQLIVDVVCVFLQIVGSQTAHILTDKQRRGSYLCRPCERTCIFFPSVSDQLVVLASHCKPCKGPVFYVYV